MERPKVLMMSHSLPPFVHDLCVNLAGAGCGIHLLTSGQAPKIASRLQELGVSVDSMALGEPFGNGPVPIDFIKRPGIQIVTQFLRMLVKVVALGKKHRTHLLHGHWVLPSGLVCALGAKILGIPCVITAHGRCIRYEPEAGQVLPSKPYIRAAVKIAARWASRIIVCSENSMEHAGRLGIPQGKLLVIPNGINLEEFSPSADTRGVRAELRCDGGKLVLAVAYIRKLKGIHFLIRAMPEVLESLPEARLAVVGDGPYLGQLMSLAAELDLGNSVVFLGHREHGNLAPYYAASDVVAIPSLDEGFGVVALEAMASGKAIVASKVGGLKEILDDSSAVLVGPGDTSGLAAGVLRVLQDEELATSMGAGNRRRARSRFDWKRIAMQINDVYQDLVDDRRRL